MATDMCKIQVSNDPIQFCSEEKKDWHLVCETHWQQLPTNLQDEIWRQFRVAKGSSAHFAAIDACVRFLQDEREYADHVYSKRGLSGFGLRPILCCDLPREQHQREQITTPPTDDAAGATGEQG